nr:MAG TPA: Putative tail protein [Caudoviricetes sp.]
MYTTSTAYKTEIQKRSRTFECRVTIGDRVFTNNEVQSIDLNGGIQDVFSIGNTPSMCLELVLRNTTDTIFTTNSVKVEIGLKIGNTIEYIPLGIFNIEDIKKDDYTTKFTCYDNMTKFEIAYFSSLGDKPTLQQVVNELASKTGVQFTGSLPSYTVKKLEGFTCREVLGYVASLCGGNALITRDGEFTIVYPTDISRDVGEGVFDLQRDEVKYKVGKITCQIKEQETISKGSLGTDSMELSFENPWVTETILTDIYNRLNGFNYLGYTMKWQGDLSLDIGDIITYTDAKKVTRKLPILYRKLSYDGGLDSELSAKGETKNKNSFNSSGSMSNKLNRVVTEVAIVNKAFIDYANINDANIKNLQVETAKIHNLEVETANINNILAGNIGSGSIQTIHLTGKNVVIDNAVIKSAMIDSLDLSKLNAGTISTNKFRITSDNGGIEIVGATQQFKDENNKVRIQMGQDTQGNFNFILRGADGTTTLIDHTGIKEKAIADDLIKSNMVAADAIGEKQINYSSLITGLNKDDNTSLIKASKVAIDLTGQSLEVAFSSLKSNIDNMEIGGVNLFVKKTATKNKYLNNSGVEVDEPNWFYTDYINVEGMKNIIASGYVNLGSAPSTCYYDSNKRFVKGINNKGQSLSKLITIDSGISYIRFSCDIRGFETLKLEQGTKSTVYSPSPEDIDQVTQSLQTQINANIKGIETLVKDTTIKQDGNTVKLQDFYTTFKQTSESVGVKLSSLESVGFAVVNLQRVSGGKYRDASIESWKVASSAIDDYFIDKGGALFKDAYVIRVNAPGSAPTVYSKYPIAVQSGEKYTISLEYGSSGTGFNARLSRIALQINSSMTDEDSWTTREHIELPATNGIWTRKSHTFTVDDTTKRIRLVFQASSSNSAYALYFDKIMVTKGDRVYDWRPSEEDVQESFKANEASIEATNKELAFKVTQSEIDNSINAIEIGSTNLLRNTGIEKDTSYFSLANGVTRDTSVKCLGTNTFKYDISGSTVDVWRSANPTPVDVVEGEQYSASGYINIASAAINNTATFQLEIQWYDASGKRILTNGTAVDRSIRNKWQLIKCEGKVAPVGAVKANCRIWVQRNGMCWVGRLQLEKGTKCSDWSSSPRDTEQRVNSVEQKITATAITTTITEAINAGTNSFTTMQFVLDKNGATIKNGALRILNNAGTEVLKGDVAGNLIINGLFKQYTSSGIPSIAIQNNMIEIYDWDPPSHKPENKIGGICSVNGTYGSYGRRASVAVYGDINHALILGWDSLNDGIHPVLTIDKPEVVSKLQPVTLWENMSIVDTAKFDFLGKDNNGGTTRQGQIWISSSQDFIITSNFLNRSGTVKLASYKDGSSSAYTNLSANPTGVRIHGALTIDGGKARAVKTTYGTTTLNAVESADALFEDIGEGVVGEDGVCYIYIDPILLDTIDTKCNYQVFVQAYGEGNVYPVERTETYFIVNGTPGLKFGWRLTAKQRGYENYRLEMIDYENPEQDYLDSLREEEIFKEDINYEELGYAYLENYEKELLANG